VSDYAELARLGTATIHEAQGKRGVVDLDLIQLIPGSRVAGPARIALCGQGDNLMVHAVMAAAQPGDVVVLTMPVPEPIALIGDLLMTQAKGRGVAGLLVDGAVRDTEDLVKLGVPVWTRWIRVSGAVKTTPGALDVPVQVGGAEINPGDAVIMDTDGVVVVPAETVDAAIAAGREREDKERVKREKLQAGALSYEIDGLREIVEGGD
jgi:4-hydroxy-4-methyl-2-oxoglutarate aldolase